MKETELLQEDKIEIVKQQEKKTEIKYIGSLKPKRGHTLFEIDLKTGVAVPATYESKDADYTVALKGYFSGGRKSVITKEGCVYISALNKKNALKKLNQ